MIGIREKNQVMSVDEAITTGKMVYCGAHPAEIMIPRSAQQPY